jgi:hypothetical protein
MGYLSASFDPSLVALNSDAASSAMVEANTASSAAAAAYERASDASSAVASRSAIWDKASAASSVAAANAASIATLSGQIITDHGALGGLTDDDHSLYLLVDGTRGLSGNWNIGNFKLGINTAPAHPLHIVYAPGDATGQAAYLDLDPAGTLTGGQTHTGLNVNVNTAVNRDGNSYTVRGAFIGAYASGAADVSSITGLELQTQHNVATDLNILYGLQHTTQFSNCDVGSAYGLYSSTIYSTNSSGTAFYGNYVNVQMASTGNLGTAYGYRAYINQSAGTLTSAYLFAGFYNGTVGTKWGIYISGEDKSYFSGNVLIGTRQS